MTRRCGSCSLCCRLLPMQAGPKPGLAKTVDKLIEREIMTVGQVLGMTADFDKPAGQRCPHQRRSDAGCCSIYGARPFDCRFWNCEWVLGSAGTERLGRPDRTHYVIDCSPDYVTVTDTGTPIPVVQVWVDPRYPNAHRNPALRAYLDARGQAGYATLVRWSDNRGMVMFPPSMTGGDWIEKAEGSSSEAEHSNAQKLAALGAFTVNLRRPA